MFEGLTEEEIKECKKALAYLENDKRDTTKYYISYHPEKFFPRLRLRTEKTHPTLPNDDSDTND